MRSTILHVLFYVLRFYERILHVLYFDFSIPRQSTLNFAKLKHTSTNTNPNVILKMFHKPMCNGC